MNLRVCCVSAAAILALSLLPLTSPPSAHGDARTLAAAAAGDITLKGDCLFGRSKGTFTAKLKPSGDKNYEVVYDVTWNGRNSTWKGTIKGDLKGEIRGTGASNSGTFEYSGKFVDGVLKCTATEVGGRGRRGSITLAS